MPWDEHGGNDLNATRCSPVVEDPREVGESCSFVGSYVSGIDDCGLGAMCWNFDAQTDFGECVAFCQGSEANPICADPCRVCHIFARGIPILCLPQCDVVVQDCDVDEACYPRDGSFRCFPDASGDVGAIGDPCDYFNSCDPGTFCADAGVVPACDRGAKGCCAPFCAVDASDTCGTQLLGTTCVPFFDDGEDPATCFGSGRVGGCSLAE